MLAGLERVLGSKANVVKVMFLALQGDHGPVKGLPGVPDDSNGLTFFRAVLGDGDELIEYLRHEPVYELTMHLEVVFGDDHQGLIGLLARIYHDGDQQALREGWAGEQGVGEPDERLRNIIRDACTGAGLESPWASEGDAS